MTGQLQQALDAARQQLADLYGDRLRHVILFGSQARGDAQPDSDVDVLVVLDAPVDAYRETRRLVDLALGLMSRFGVYFSFKPYDQPTYEEASLPLMRNVRAEGIEL